jgi:hypothetical protein
MDGNLKGGNYNEKKSGFDGGIYPDSNLEHFISNQFSSCWFKKIRFMPNCCWLS